MHKVLILTAGFGNGHNAAALNVRDALETVSEDAQVEVLDLFAVCYGKTNELVKKLFLGIVQYAPKVWEGMYSVIDRTSVVEKQMGHFRKLRDALADIVQTTEPDVIVTTYPAYNFILDDIYKDHRERPFSHITIVTDSITVNSVWYGASTDWYIVANQPTADVMIQAGVPAAKIRVFGFPVSPRFDALAREGKIRRGDEDGTRRLSYIIHHGKKKVGPIIEQLLEIPNTHLTIVCGADAKLKNRLSERTASRANRVWVVGWTNRIPDLLCASDLVITKAGGAIVQEALAATCPILVNQVLPGQEEGNANLVELLGVGAIATDDLSLLKLARRALELESNLWSGWKRSIQKHSRPDASLRIAEFILLESQPSDMAATPRLEQRPPRPRTDAPEANHFSIQPSPRPLLCDFHMHSNYSDGKLTVAELIDFYGHREFDCICVTDHVAERRRVVGKIANLSNLTLPWDQLDEYFDVIEQQKRRAWKKYGMIVMAGLEFNKDGLSVHSSAHLLGIDLKAPILPDLGLKKLILAIQGQGALAVASHPHHFQAKGERDTLYLWHRVDKFAPLLDAWEIANRENIFNSVGLRRLPFLANSDFHEPSHIYSWKTLLNCEKDPEAIKACIRENKDISITLYRDPKTRVRGMEPSSRWMEPQPAAQVNKEQDSLAATALPWLSAESSPGRL